MHAFRVDDMTCGHCASTLTKAIRGVDKKATVTVDLSQHLVMVEPTEADAQELRDAIAEAGYTPVPVQAPTGVAMPAQSGCCGCHSGRGPGQA
ncbi:MAG: heavy-metal-associated domain-containing protein [Rhizobacter sp.]|nr:heavy-metal-associated domain-containing protein [Rhizobacter sp.]